MGGTKAPVRGPAGLAGWGGGEEEDRFRMEAPGPIRSWGLGVTPEPLDKGTERAVVPVEGLGIAEG